MKPIMFLINPVVGSSIECQKIVKKSKTQRYSLIYNPHMRDASTRENLELFLKNDLKRLIDYNLLNLVLT